jgi:hypothetical protein
MACGPARKHGHPVPAGPSGERDVGWIGPDWAQHGVSLDHEQDDVRTARIIHGKFTFNIPNCK